MRITSPNQVFSEWFEGVDLITYEGNVVESGEHEICVSARVPMGSVKVELDIISYDTQLVQAFLDEMLKTRKTEAAVMSVVERITERVQKMFGSVRHNSFMVRRDTNLQRKNLHYIDVFSTLQTVFMLVSGVAQVIIIRKLFFVDAKKIRI
uniref:GOLD domain-containing protein n=1 Tax=Ascaris lumbricoides TaxID=6252 RepID=A0A0M3HTI5_ASCLU